MKKIPYIENSIQKKLDTVKPTDPVVLNTHSSNFHADDIFATSTLRLLFRYLDKKIKTKVVRSIDPQVHTQSTFVYDVGKIYDPKKLCFDHHQEGGAGVRPSGVHYAAFGLIWKHFGPSLCALYTEKKTGKIPTLRIAQEQAQHVEKKLVAGIDAMDNGQMTYTELFEDTAVPTIDEYLGMYKISIASKSDNLKEVAQAFDKGFMNILPIAETMLEHLLGYAYIKNTDERVALKAYAAAKDKRVVICDRFYGYNYGKMPEPLVIVYPDARGGWAAKNVRLNENMYDARFYFPEIWRGKTDAELSEVTGISGALFCHNSGFMITAKTKKDLISMIYKAFEIQGLK